VVDEPLFAWRVNCDPAADREMIEEWRDAVSRLRDDADAELLGVKR
jgi:hypothetical protein